MYDSQSRSPTMSSVLGVVLSTSGVAGCATSAEVASAPACASSPARSGGAVSSSSDSSRTGFSTSSCWIVFTSSSRESCSSLIACCSWGVITSDWVSLTVCLSSSAIVYLQPEVLAEVDLAHGRILGDLGRRTFADDAPVLDDVGAVADVERLADVVIRDHDPDPTLAQLPDDLLDVDHGDRVDAGERLVQQHEARVEHERAGDLDAPSLAAGEGGALLLALGHQVELAEQRLHALFSLAAAQRQRLQDRQDVL